MRRPARRGPAPLLLALALAPTASRGDGVAHAPAFADVTAAAGLDHPHELRVFDNPYAEIMAGYTALGAAAAAADYDGDGDEDLFVTTSSSSGRNRLYRNEGGLRFVDVAAAAGVAAGNDAHDASADALWGDFDGDGRPDLFVARFGRPQLFHNLGDGTFREMAREAGLDRYANSIAAIAFDADADGRLDLLVGNYFGAVDVFRPDTPRFFPESFETADNGGGVTLWRNAGAAAGTPVRFVDATEAAGLAQSGWTLDVGAGDADRDGDLDLYVACDFGTDRFFVNRGDGTFADRTREAIGVDTKKGMNAEWGDFDGDGWLDVYVTNITDDYMREGNFLWHNDGDGGGGGGGGPSFTDLAAETGTRDTGWGWGAKLFDFDDDGWLDLYAVNGWVSAGPESYVPDVFAMILRVMEEKDGDFRDARDWPPMRDKSLSGHQRNRLFHNQEGALFVEVAARHGLDSLRDGRGLVVADLDGDGRADLLVTNAGAPPHLFRNTTPPPPAGAHRIAFALAGAAGLGDAIGADVRLLAGDRERVGFVDPGNGFAAQGSRQVRFGLGPHGTARRVAVRWPSGRRTVLGPLVADRVYRLVPPAAPSPATSPAALGLTR